jgi:heme-degrading monooxygenase HmoA
MNEAPTLSGPARSAPRSSTPTPPPKTTVDAGGSVVTLINVFETAPSKQNDLIELLERATVDVLQHLPGFISSTLHRGVDGKHVANYAQWATEADFQNMLQNPRATAHMKQATEMALVRPSLYRVASVHHRSPSVR